MSKIKYPFLDLAIVNRPYFERLNESARKVVESGRYIGGDTIEQFEQMLADICNASYAIGVSNGLDALRLIIEGYKHLELLHEDDEVIVAANTYIASVLAITHAGLKPVLVDPDPLTFNLSAKEIERNLSPRTRAIMTVDLYGRINWNSDIHRIAVDNNLLMIEDAAQSIGARSAVAGLSGSHMAGAVGHAGALSFYPTKNIGALGDAGAVITNDKQLADAVRALANYGSDRRYHNIYAGFNCRLDPIQAAFLMVKLTDLDAVNERRRLRAETYNATISNELTVTPSLPSHRLENVWHQYVLRVKNGRRDDFRQYLLDRGVATDIHYPVNIYDQPCYSSLPHPALPVTDNLNKEIVSLPVSDCTSLDDVREISQIINSYK